VITLSMRDPAFKRRVMKEVDVLSKRCLRKAKRVKGSATVKQRSFMKCIKGMPSHNWEWVAYFKSKSKRQSWRRR